MSSLATFVIGLFAARELSVELLGAYALVFSAFQLAAVVPCQLVFTPLEVATIGEPPEHRLRLLRHTLALGFLPSLLPALAVVGWVLVVPPGIPAPVVVALTLTGAATALVSPIQDHLRRMLHIAHASWYAVAVSAVQLLVCVAGTALFLLTRLPEWWAPFGVLGSANLLSLAVGLLLARRSEGSPTGLARWHLRDIARSGGWLLVVGVIPFGTAFFASTLVAQLAGAAQLGFAEAARICGTPVWVLALGLSATAGPRIVAAAQKRDRAAARAATRTFTLLVSALGLSYFLIVGHRWAWNPFALLIPKAYVESGLVAVTVAGQLVLGIAYASRFEMLGAARERGIAVIELLGNSGRAAVALAAAVLGAYVLPLGLLVLGVARYAGCRFDLRTLYRPARSPQRPGAPPGRDLEPIRPESDREPLEQVP